MAGDAAKLGMMLADDFRDLSPDGGNDKAANIAANVKAAATAAKTPAADAPKAVSDNYIIQCSASSATITHRSVFPYKDASWIEQNYADDFVGVNARTGKFSR